VSLKMYKEDAGDGIEKLLLAVHWHERVKFYDTSSSTRHTMSNERFKFACRLKVNVLPLLPLISETISMRGWLNFRFEG
jgi:hypothetical protein